MQESLAAEQYELAAELLRFLIPPQEASALMASADLATPRQRLSIRTQPAPAAASSQAAQVHFSYDLPFLDYLHLGMYQQSIRTMGHL